MPVSPSHSDLPLAAATAKNFFLSGRENVFLFRNVLDVRDDENDMKEIEQGGGAMAVIIANKVMR